MGVFMLFSMVTILLINNDADRRVEKVEKKAAAIIHNNLYHDQAVREREALRAKVKEASKPLINPYDT